MWPSYPTPESVNVGVQEAGTDDLSPPRNLIRHMNDDHEAIIQTVLAPLERGSEDPRDDFPVIAARPGPHLQRRGDDRTAVNLAPPYGSRIRHQDDKSPSAILLRIPQTPR